MAVRAAADERRVGMDDVGATATSSLSDGPCPSRGFTAFKVSISQIERRRLVL